MAAENYFLRNSAGESCGPGEREALSLSGGAAPVQKTLDAVGDTWSYEEVARVLTDGQWAVTIYYDSNTGGGPQNVVRILVQVRNDDCSVKQTILDKQQVVSKGQNGAQFTVTENAGVVELEEGDVITLQLSKVQGNQVIKARYNGTAAQKALSKLRQPGDNLIDSKAEVSWVELEVPDGQ